MDEKIVLTRQQILSSALKVSKCRSLVKRRFQSLGLKYADSQEVRDRLTMIEKKRVSSFGKILSEQRYRFPILHGKYPV